jgi:glycosyltransferase involved in cell wall biosynthesis
LSDLSIVIPVCNEEGNIVPLYDEIVNALKSYNFKYEIIFVNDGSTDTTVSKISNLSDKDSKLVLKNLELNMGQGLALIEGIKSSQYDYICVLDGDRQFYPGDILKLAKIKNDENLDFICGKRTQRSDDVFLKILPSIMGNKFISFLFKSDFEDLGCSLKIVHKKHILHLNPFKNIHRYLNLLLLEQGLRYKEIPVDHRHRTSGKTKYTMFKFWGVIFEVLWLRFVYKR